MSPPALPPLQAAGKFLHRGGEKVFLRGISYGAFAPGKAGHAFPEAAQIAADFAQIRSLGFDTIRLYDLPHQTLLDAASAEELQLFIDIPWAQHVDFLRNSAAMAEISHTVVTAVQRLGGHPAVAAFLVGNEIEKTLVRWMGPRRVQAFLEKLIDTARANAPGKLVSYATYPSTEYLMPRNADFLAVNVYLEQPQDLQAYLQRLQNLAGNKPLVLTETGLDSASHGAEAQAEAFKWQRQLCGQAGAAGHFWFGYTDEWFRGGQLVTDWRFGLVDAKRQPRAAADVARLLNAVPPGSPALPAEPPRFSVIVCTRNGSATLPACLRSLQSLRYPNFEVLLIDDGSTEDIASIAKAYPNVQYHRQTPGGLSVARNLGAELATGEILAYTDDDCIVEEDWLGFLAAALQDISWAAAGGPNIPPPPRNRTEAIVAAAPGSPAHVLMNDDEAEHLPGCNFAVRKAALQAIGGFRPCFTTAGDDVDVCWRLRAAGGRLRFVAPAMVWHHRRRSVRAYLRQQRGYGTAEALLMKEHPGRFGILGGARWRGAIYGDWHAPGTVVEGSVFHGAFGNGLFQGMYQQETSCWLHWLSGVVWGALALLSFVLGWQTAGWLIVAASLGVAVCRMRRLPISPFVLDWREQALLLTLCWLQPIVREGARALGMARLKSRPGWKAEKQAILPPRRPTKLSIPLGEMAFWSESGCGREQLLQALLVEHSQRKNAVRADDGWRWFDLEFGPEKQASPAVLSVTEYHGSDRQLTRVRLLLRVRMRLLMFIAIAATALVAHLGEDGLVLVGLAMLALGSLALGIRQSVRSIIEAAAAEIGLTKLPADSPR